MKHGRMVLRPAGSVRSTPQDTPQSSAYPSAYPSEDEDAVVVKAFPFLGLPSELRNKIYGTIFAQAPKVLDLDPDNYKNVYRKLPIFLVSRQIHNEASHHFYSTHTIRLFPCGTGRFFKAKKPLLARIARRYRAYITSFELRLGPGFGAPPRGWVVNDALGLADTVNTRVLKVLVEIDPSQPFLNGFRAHDGFYEKFSQNLLDRVLDSTPSIVEVQMDAYTSVKKSGPMMQGLLQVARRHNKLISWGPERGWTDADEDDDEPVKAWADPPLRDDIPAPLSVLLAALPEVTARA